MPRRSVDITGQKFFDLTALYPTQNRIRQAVAWYCVCVCDKTLEVGAGDLRAGRIKSCGCRESGNLLHGANKNNKAQHPLYRIWRGMRERCNNKNHKDYKHYGARGISVCAEWKSYIAFRDYMLTLPNCPSEVQVAGTYIELTIDRKNNDEDYKPGNVRWATQLQQANNKTSNRIIPVNGTRLSLADAVRRYGKASYDTIHDRLEKGWSFKKAFLTPSPLGNQR